MLNQIINADCLEFLSKIENESVDLFVTDCPYKICAGGVRVATRDDTPSGIFAKKDYNKTDPKGVLSRQSIVYDNNAIGRKWQKADGVPCAVKNGKMFHYNDIIFKEWLPSVYRVLKKGTHAYIMINARNLCELQNEAEKVGFEFQNLLIWDKGNATPNKYYMQAAEFILMLSKRPARNINNMGSTTIISIPNIIGNKLHPTEKPITLMKTLIENSSNPGDVVLDCFAGSGSTAIAAYITKRNFLACDIDPNYVAVAQERFKKLETTICNEFVQTNLL